MKEIKLFSLIVVVALVSIAGTYFFLKNASVPATLPAPTSAPAPSPPVDPYKNWTTISPGGVVELKIPPGCAAGGAAGSTYVTCPTADTPEPLPTMVISSDGVKVNIRRWEGLGWENWNEVLSTLKIKTPQSRAIQISVEK